MRFISNAVAAGIALVLLCSAGLQSAQSKNESMSTRTFNVLPTVNEKISCTGIDESGYSVDSSVGQEVDYKTFFQDMGIEWPEGSYIKYYPAKGKFIVRNTPENMEQLKAVMDELMLTPSQIEIEVKYIEFPVKEVEKLAKKSNLNCNALLDLWRHDKGTMISAPIIVAQAGTEATVKGVTEYIYPTDFTVQPIMSDTNNSPLVIEATVVEPSSFETREVGSVLSVLPEVSPEGNLITLTLQPEQVYPPEWKDFANIITNNKGKKINNPMEQPFFHTHMYSTSISVYSGSTILLGGGTPNRDRTMLVYAFVTARMIDPTGEELKKNRTSKP